MGATLAALTLLLAGHVTIHTVPTMEMPGHIGQAFGWRTCTNEEPDVYFVWWESTPNPPAGSIAEYVQTWEYAGALDCLSGYQLSQRCDADAFLASTDDQERRLAVNWPLPVIRNECFAESVVTHGLPPELTHPTE